MVALGVGGSWWGNTLGEAQMEEANHSTRICHGGRWQGAAWALVRHLASYPFPLSLSECLQNLVYVCGSVPHSQPRACAVLQTTLPICPASTADQLTPLFCRSHCLLPNITSWPTCSAGLTQCKAPSESTPSCRCAHVCGRMHVCVCVCVPEGMRVHACVGASVRAC